MTHAAAPPRALIFGAIGTLAETSDLQRRAFNAAFREAGLRWEWTAEVYADLLRQSGGRARIADEAARHGVTVDAAALHARKTAHFLDLLRRAAPPLRRGVAETVAAARGGSLRLALATTTARAVLDAVLAHAGPSALADGFDLVLSAADGVAPKPDPEVYRRALDRLGIAPCAAVAIEDSPESAASATAAGVRVIAFPGAYHLGRDFGGPTVERLSPEMFGIAPAATPRVGA